MIKPSKPIAAIRQLALDILITVLRCRPYKLLGLPKNINALYQSSTERYRETLT